MIHYWVFTRLIFACAPFLSKHVQAHKILYVCSNSNRGATTVKYLWENQVNTTRKRRLELTWPHIFNSTESTLEDLKQKETQLFFLSVSVDGWTLALTLHDCAGKFVYFSSQSALQWTSYCGFLCQCWLTYDSVWVHIQYTSSAMLGKLPFQIFEKRYKSWARVSFALCCRTHRKRNSSGGAEPGKNEPRRRRRNRKAGKRPVSRSCRCNDKVYRSV